MTAFLLENVSFSFGAREILRDASWAGTNGDRIGLIGRNGCGKTTLLSILAGELRPERGTVHRKRGATVGYLRQRFSLPGLDENEATLLDAAMVPMQKVKRIEEEIAATEELMQAGQVTRSVMDLYERLRAEFGLLGGGGYEGTVQRMLGGLGFGPEHFTRKLASLSGGEKSKLALAVTLLERPDLLLLDEPTNHLDIAGIEHLERILLGYDGCIVVVSHDRYFLDRIATSITELRDAGLRTLRGGYTFFMKEKRAQEERQQKEHDLAVKEVERIKEFIRRNIAAQKAQQAKSRQRMLDKMEIPEAPKRDDAPPVVRFRAAGKPYSVLATADKATKRVGGKKIFEKANFLVRKGDRVGIIGPNGSGKTTLIRCILGLDGCDSGAITLGEGTIAAYFDQEVSGLDPDKSVYDEMYAMAPLTTAKSIRDIAGGFLFQDDDVFKKTGELSGGEKARLKLAMLVLAKHTLLVFDEPSNHLDTLSREAFEEALLGYDGTIIVVSHDRYLLDRIANRIFVVDRGLVEVFEGNYTDTLERRESAAASGKAAAPARGRRPASARADKPGERLRRESKERDVRRRRLQKAEMEIAMLEGEIGMIKAELTAPENASNWQRLMDLQKEKDGLSVKLDEAMKGWEALAREVEEEETRDRAEK